MRIAQRELQSDAYGRVGLGEDYVALRLPVAQRALSFALHRGGFAAARVLAIHEVRNADLPADTDPAPLLAARMAALGSEADGVGMLTSRRIAAVEVASRTEAAVFARALVTCGLSNALRVGDPPGPLTAWGTINVIVQLSAALTDHARIEALSLIAEARTAVVLEAGIPSRRSGAAATGTGTDCIAVVAPEADHAERYAGKHTLAGHLIGAATHSALALAVSRWKEECWRP